MNFARNSFFYENISFFKLNNQKNKQKGKRLFTFLLKYKRIEKGKYYEKLFKKII